jgi:hypothetical protein
MDRELSEFVEFDALVSASYTGAADVTDHPVEGAPDITDHIRRRPKELQLRGVVSNFPILALASLHKDPAVPGTDRDTRAEAAFLFLEGLKDDGKLVHVSTSLFDIEDMAITMLSCTRDKDSSNVADISLTLREILVARTELVVQSTEPLDAGKKEKLNLGKKTLKPASQPVAEDTRSFGVRLINAAAGVPR